MDFDVDIFISYAHIDNEALTQEQEGWIASLHRVLEVRLAQLLGEKPRIWRDPKLQGNDYFGETLVDQLHRTALLVSVLTPRYVKSEWCVREAKEFVRAAEETGGVRVKDKARLFKVVKTPVPLEDHPEEMQGLLGYEFFEIDPQTGRPREFSRRFGPEAERLYWARVEDLAYDICDLLELLRTKQGTSTAPASGHAVYLAETTFDLSQQRDQIRRELLQRGHTVLPDRPLPLRGPELEAFVGESLEGAALSIHLIGGTYGIVPEAATYSVGEVQNALAAERSRAAGLPRLIWMPTGLEARDERQHAFVEALMNDPAVQHGADVLQTSLEDLKTIIQDRLAPRAQTPPAPPEAAAGQRPPLLYLIADQADLEAVAPLEDYLFDQGLEVALPLFEGEEGDIREDHVENLRMADAVLVYYGGATEAWLRGKLRDLRKAPGFGRTAPFRATAVLVAGPADPRKARFRTHDVDAVIQAPDGFSPDDLAALLDAIKTPGGGTKA